MDAFSSARTYTTRFSTLSQVEFGTLTSVVRKIASNPPKRTKMMKNGFSWCLAVKCDVLHPTHGCTRLQTHHKWPIEAFSSARTYATRFATLSQVESGTLTSVVRKIASKPAKTAKMMKKWIFLMFSGTMRCVTPNAWLYPTKDKSQVTNGSLFECRNLCHSICYTFSGQIWHPYQRSKENSFKSAQNSKNDGKVDFPDV